MKLRELEFRQYNDFIPTAHHMTLSETEFYKAIQIKEQRHFPGEYEYVSYTIAQLCSVLTEFANS